MIANANLGKPLLKYSSVLEHQTQYFSELESSIFFHILTFKHMGEKKSQAKQTKPNL